MNKKSIYIVLVIVLLCAFHFLLKPYLHKRTVTRVVLTVLDSWKKRDFFKAIEQWEDPEKAPPVDNLNAYEIKEFLSFKNSERYHAKIFVEIEFSKEDLFPKEKIWVFELRRSTLGWKISNFHPAD